ncbi:Uncharacterised protein [Mycobacteroides abscessus subsp. abscessus]|nr:Uncharacterised protein [Mycobacteroides abscessus subsp. abscessus]SKU53552.1 Uncharacterised protein [Mycobacteroides abscessus subsp. abscessus]
MGSNGSSQGATSSGRDRRIRWVQRRPWRTATSSARFIAPISAVTSSALTAAGRSTRDHLAGCCSFASTLRAPTNAA